MVVTIPANEEVVHNDDVLGGPYSARIIRLFAIRHAHVIGFVQSLSIEVLLIKRYCKIHCHELLNVIVSECQSYRMDWITGTGGN